MPLEIPKAFYVGERVLFERWKRNAAEKRKIQNSLYLKKKSVYGILNRRKEE